MDYSTILITLDQSIKAYRNSVLTKQYETSLQITSTIEEAAKKLTEATESMKNEHEERNR